MSPNLQAALEQPFATLPSLIALHAAQRGSHPALVVDGQVPDFAGLHAGIERVAGALQRDGLKPGDVVAICAATSPAYVSTYLGAARAGVAVAPLPPSATAEQLAGLAANSGARLLFADADTVAQWSTPADALPRILLDDSTAGGTPGHTPWSRWLQHAPSPDAVDLRPEDAFNLIYSSGTTGLPKGIVQSCGMRWAQVRRAPASGFGPEAVTLLAIPLYSNLTLTYLFSALGTGGTVLLMTRFNAGQYLQLAARHRATHSMLVPVQFRRLMDHPDFERSDLSTLTRKFCAGAPFAPELKAEVLRRWPGELTEYYGLTEGGGRTELQAHRHPDKLHTVGRISAGNDLRLIDEEGRELGPGETGEIVGRSATMMNGYHGLPEATRAAEWHDAQGQRFIRTGDVGRFDADGFLQLVDRRKDMIISGGFNLYPSDLEAVLRGHPDVADVAVVGVPSAEWGETPVAWVVARSGATASEAELRDWMNQRVGKTQRLHALRFTTELPRSAVGKVLKRELREAFVAQPAA
ncbi:MAG: acyl--CoA ligase [Burkholderiaceae bacterium]|nr:acyl--CoA ligase [Burkholderiaceae bacterium]